MVGAGDLKDNFLIVSILILLEPGVPCQLVLTENKITISTLI